MNARHLNFLSFDRYEKHKDSKKGGAHICTSYVLFCVCVRLKRIILRSWAMKKVGQRSNPIVRMTHLVAEIYTPPRGICMGTADKSICLFKAQFL